VLLKKYVCGLVIGRELKEKNENNDLIKITGKI
jgi:hypothetical protein